MDISEASLKLSTISDQSFCGRVGRQLKMYTNDLESGMALIGIKANSSYQTANGERVSI